jgi:hypothetical protein
LTGAAMPEFEVVGDRLARLAGCRVPPLMADPWGWAVSSGPFVIVCDDNSSFGDDTGDWTIVGDVGGAR